MFSHRSLEMRTFLNNNTDLTLLGAPYLKRANPLRSLPQILTIERKFALINSILPALECQHMKETYYVGRQRQCIKVDTLSGLGIKLIERK